ncbi:unnamed protein product [Brassica rapa subsp. narinosa]
MDKIAFVFLFSCFRTTMVVPSSRPDRGFFSFSLDFGRLWPIGGLSRPLLSSASTFLVIVLVALVSSDGSLAWSFGLSGFTSTSLWTPEKVDLESQPSVIWFSKTEIALVGLRIYFLARVGASIGPSNTSQYLRESLDCRLVVSWLVAVQVWETLSSDVWR